MANTVQNAAANAAVAKKRHWDPWKMFDVSEDELRLMKDRAKNRAEHKAEYLKKATDPYRAILREEQIFDPAYQRFISLKATQAERFRGCRRSYLLAFMVWPLPVYLYARYNRNLIKTRDEMYKSGDVMYKDRQWGPIAHGM